MTENEFLDLVKNFFYGVGILIAAFFVWAAFKRIKNDHQQGGMAQIALTIIKVGILLGIAFFLIEYADKKGYLAQLIQYLKIDVK